MLFAMKFIDILYFLNFAICTGHGDPACP